MIPGMLEKENATNYRSSFLRDFFHVGFQYMVFATDTLWVQPIRQLQKTLTLILRVCIPSSYLSQFHS